MKYTHPRQKVGIGKKNRRFFFPAVFPTDGPARATVALIGHEAYRSNYGGGPLLTVNRPCNLWLYALNPYLKEVCVGPPKIKYGVSWKRAIWNQ